MRFQAAECNAFNAGLLLNLIRLVSCDEKKVQLNNVMLLADDGLWGLPSNCNRIPSRYKFFSATALTGKALYISNCHKIVTTLLP